MHIKNKIDNKNYERQKEKLKADFINSQGIFREFNINNSSTIEKIDCYDIGKGMGK